MYVEGKDTVRFPAIISAIGTEVVSHDMYINNNTVGLHFIKNSTYVYKVLNFIFFKSLVVKKNKKDIGYQ